MINVILLFLSAFLMLGSIIGIPLYLNFYDGNSSIAFIKIIYWAFVMLRFVLIALLIRCVLFLARRIFKEGRAGKLLRGLYYGLNGLSLLVYASSFSYSMVRGIWAYFSMEKHAFQNFPIDIVSMWFVGHIIEMIRLYLLSFTKKLDPKPRKKDDTHDAAFEVNTWRAFKSS